MLNVTYLAAEHVAYMLAKHEVPDDVALRIHLQKGSVKIGPDKIRSGDETFDHNGMVVMVVDQQTLFLGDKTIDLVTENDGPHLIVN